MRHSLVVLLVVAMVGAVTAQTPLEFDVASIRRNTSDRPTPSGPPPNPASGQLTVNWIPARFLATRAFPDLTVPLVVEGLPAWADSERWDVTVKFKPGASAQEQAQMWRTLLADRMKLSAHYEMRKRPAYNLVLARQDGRLGPQLKPSTLECPPLDPSQPPTRPPAEVMEAMRPGGAMTPAAEQLLMSQCRGTFGAGNTTYGGAVPIQAVVLTIQRGVGLDRPVIDKTGLQGLYSIKLTFHNSPNPPGPDDPPSIFTAVQEQLGLKLEAGTAESQILVVDHIERPTEN